MSFRTQIPNFLTTANLLSGFLALYFLYNGPHWVVICCIAAALVADLMDGWAARRLGVAGPLGVQLDSLADMVSFGILPGSMMLVMSNNGSEQLAPAGLIAGGAVSIGALWRLARFNIDERQSEGFLGLPTPAMAMYVTGLFGLWTQGMDEFSALWSLTGLVIQGILLAFLMLSDVPFPSLKDVKRHRSFAYMIFGAILIGSTVFAIIAPAGLLWQALLLYICSALIYSLIIKK